MSALAFAGLGVSSYGSGKMKPEGFVLATPFSLAAGYHFTFGAGYTNSSCMICTTSAAPM
eukprot:CAMPEP_0172664776 /NCGR_PEP_ID=MMETSP1074-20121228/6827_1 /TAXON_ID=2916 /ORGANISM="Ceratium fusus, Strain PA161109" /LENGTH=59 /DNA_ID=CAMNT_0013480993 /DNA_START=174 /DNA_END=350 /DNA_ORIENTATION=+